MATHDPTPTPLDPLRGILPHPGAKPAGPARDSHAALRGANRLALVCGCLFTVLIGVIALMALGSGVSVVERLGIIAGLAAGALGFWGIYGLTRFCLAQRDRQHTPADPPPSEASPRH